MRRIAVVVLILCYLLVWNAQGSKEKWLDSYLSPALPAPLIKIVSGFAQKMMGFGIFVKVSIFSGGTLQNVEESSYADNLEQNLDVMTQLYPEFIDAYYYSQSFLSPISSDFAGRANIILSRGIEQHPDYLYFQFFKAFNHYYYMDQPVAAAEIFYELSQHSDAPPWFGHLAGALMATGGELRAGLIMHETMLAVEQDDSMKRRYRSSIFNFKEALRVQSAADKYRQENGSDIQLLEELVPRYLGSFPQFSHGYVLLWEPPVLRLVRPE